MSTTNDFEKLKETIAAITEIRYPNIPVDISCQEAEALYHTAIADKGLLTARGLKQTVINALPTAAGACRYAEAAWENEMHEKKEAEKRWEIESPAAFDLQKLLMAEFDFAFEENPALQTKLDFIKRGDGDADMIQDLMSLSVLGKDNTSLLSTTNFDLTLLDKAETVADNMANILGKATGTRDDSSPAKLIRDKAYTHLKKYVDQVRRYGKFVFRNDPDHAAKYASEYRRNN